VFVALGIDHAMASATLSSVACLVIQNFNTLFNKGRNFRKEKFIEYKCVL
jgi:hypothetical protein